MGHRTGMVEARRKAEKMVPSGTGSEAGRELVVAALAEDLRAAAAAAATAAATQKTPVAAIGFTLRYVDIPCPSGKHKRSMLTFRGHNAGVLFCQPCEHGWTEPATHPALRHIVADSPR
jgi:hypothetical protein